MNIFRRLIKKIRDYQRNPGFSDCPSAPDVESAMQKSPLFDDTFEREQMAKSGGKKGK